MGGCIQFKLSASFLGLEVLEVLEVLAGLTGSGASTSLSLRDKQHEMPIVGDFARLHVTDLPINETMLQSGTSKNGLRKVLSKPDNGSVNEPSMTTKIRPLKRGSAAYFSISEDLM